MLAKPALAKQQDQTTQGPAVSTSPWKPRILVAEQNTLIAEGLAKLLEPEFEVVGLVVDGRALFESASRLRPNVVILDLSMPEFGGEGSGRQLKDLLPAAKIVVLSTNEDHKVATETLHSWASAFILTKSAPREIVEAVREVLKGNSYSTLRLDQELEAKALSDERLNQSRDLTVRQREVLQLLAEGRTMKEVANILGVTPRTVAFHKYKIMQRLGLKNNSDLVRLAIRAHLIPAP
jgi:DNA-binding NarL/FixJ family response regulator